MSVFGRGREASPVDEYVLGYGRDERIGICSVVLVGNLSVVNHNLKDNVAGNETPSYQALLLIY